MKSYAGSRGGVGSGMSRRGLAVFAMLLIGAQVVLFLFLRMRKDDQILRARSSSAVKSISAAVPASQANRPHSIAPTPVLPPPAPEAPPTVAGAVQPVNQLPAPAESLSASAEGGAPTVAGPPAPSGDTATNLEGADSKLVRRDKPQSRVDRERLDRGRAAERERVRLEAERERVRLEAEKERARLESERAEKARLEAEREKAELEAERARLAAERSRVGSGTETAEAVGPPRPSGSPDVLVVVVSSGAGTGSLTREEIRNIYFGRTTFWPNDTPVRAYNRPASSAAGRKFYQSVLGTSSSAFRQHWSSLQLSGGGISPATLSSPESVVARVAGSSGAIGYVLESELPADVSGLRLVRFK